MRTVLRLLAAGLLVPVALPGQQAPLAGDTWSDPGAAALHGAASAAWEEVDRALVSYTALVKRRVAAALRTPVKDRVLYHAEAASRIAWHRDGPLLVQALGLREDHPGPDDDEEPDLDFLDDAFDPSSDRLLIWSSRNDDDDDAWIRHPLGPEAPLHYRFRTGDTLTLTVPDGRRLQAVELQVLPRTADSRLLSGSLWIEPASGALVRAVYRLATPFDLERDSEVFDEEPELDRIPGLFRPITMDLTMVAVDYSLWNFEVWLPRSLHAEGMARAGIVKAPASMEVSYGIESVTTEADLARAAAAGEPEGRVFATESEAMAYLAEQAGMPGVTFEVAPGQTRRRGRRVRYLLPEDRTWLERSPHLPPPIWEDATGFTSAAELGELLTVLADLPQATPAGIPVNFYWGLDRPDLVRFNRIEGLSVGVRVEARVSGPLGPLSVEPTLRLGYADLEPRGALSVVRETVRRRLTLDVYRELRSVEEGRFLGPGNSATALVFGRDDGEYYGALGGAVTWTPPSARRQAFAVRLYGERQEAVRRNTDHSLASLFSSDPVFRDNLAADRADQVGLAVDLRPRWGTDPALPSAAADVLLQGETGTFRFARARLAVRGVVPVGSGARLAVELSGGRGWGDVPSQRTWLLGGPQSLRGYAPSTLDGTDLVRGRLEAQRIFPFGAVALFGDAGWAGPRGAFDADAALASAGVGLALLDGLIRLDVARGLSEPVGTRWDLYLDGVF